MFQYRYRKGWPDDGQPFLSGKVPCKVSGGSSDTYVDGKRCKYWPVFTPFARAFNARRDILEHKIPKMLSLFESIIVFVAQSRGINMDGFSLSRVRRYYETGVKTPLGEALMEYGFPVDAIRNLEDKFDQLRNLDLTESKTFCRQHYKEIISVFDSYEIDLFIRAMNSI